MNSRAKGCRGEREAAAAWSQVFGGLCRRGRQFAGSPDSPDIVTSHMNVHVEVKRTERGNPYSWLRQAIADAGAKVPVVLHRRNNEDWILIVRLTDAPRLAQEVNPAAQAVGGGAVPPDVPCPDLPPACEQDG